MPGNEPYRGRVAPELQRWCDEAAPQGRTTALVRVDPTTPIAELVAKLEAAGAEVNSAGPGVVTVVVGCEALASVADLDGVLAVEPVRRYELKRGPAL